MKNSTAAFVKELKAKINEETRKAEDLKKSGPKGGPQTLEGKAASSRNATKHSLSSTVIVLKGEDAYVYEQTLRDLRLDHRPRTAIEDQCIEMMAHAYWKTARCARLEKSVWDLALATATAETSPFHAMAEGFLKGANVSSALDKIARYQSEARRAYHQAAATLRKHQPYAEAALKADQKRALIQENEIGAMGLEFVAETRALELKTRTRQPVPETNSATAASGEIGSQ